MIFLCKTADDGTDLFEVDMLVPPMAGDVVLRSDDETIRQRWQVVRREFVFSEEGEAAACFLILEPWTRPRAEVSP